MRSASFIHIPRTGGASIRKALGLELGYGAHRKCSMHGDEFKFSFVRHPADRIWSAWKFEAGCAGHKAQSWEVAKLGSFEDFVFDGSLLGADMFAPMSYWLDAPVDFLGRFEQLQEDFDRLAEQLEIPHAALPHEHERPGPTWREAYTPEMLRKVSAFYHDDYQRYGYN